MAADFKRRFWVSLVLTVPILALSPMIQGWLDLRDRLSFPGDDWVQLGFATTVFFYGGWPFLSGLFRELRRKQPGMMTLIGLAIAVAYGYSAAVVIGLTGTKVFFWELATLIDVMLLGHWIEMRSVLGAGKALRELVELMPDTAHRLDDSGNVSDVSVRELKKGDRVRIKPGESAPVDGTVVDGHGTVNASMLTGESKPVEKQPGDGISAGMLNGDTSFTVEVAKAGDDTYLSQVVQTVRRAQEARSRTQDLADQAAMVLTFVAIAAGVATLISWIALGRSVDWSLERAVTVMVITCPHALGLAIPLVIAVSTSLAARQGLLIRDRSSFERARNLDVIVLDKTGTLTEGRFGVNDVIPGGEFEADEVLRLAAGVEDHSEHPIARGIVEKAKDKDLEIPQAKQFEAIAGKGAQAQVEDQRIRVVSGDYLTQKGLEPVTNEAFTRARDRGDSVVHVVRGEKVIGAIALADVIRPSSSRAVEELRNMGLRVMMVTGDDEKVAHAVGKELSLDEIFAGILPDEKADRIRQLRNEGNRVAMVGDGVNDAPALVEADLGVAVGAGTDVAIESADVVLSESNPMAVVQVVRLARRTRRKMIQNLFWATGYNVVAIPLAAGVLAGFGVLLSPAVGAIIMSASTVIVAVNARLLRLKESPEPQAAATS